MLRKVHSSHKNRIKEPTPLTMTRYKNLHFAAFEAFFLDQNNHYFGKPPKQIPSRMSHRGQFQLKPTQIKPTSIKENKRLKLQG